MRARMQYVLTRSGIGPQIIPEREPQVSPIQVRYYAPKPAWMTHIPGPWLRFGNRWALQRHLERDAEAAAALRDEGYEIVESLHREDR